MPREESTVVARVLSALAPRMPVTACLLGLTCAIALSAPAPAAMQDDAPAKKEPAKSDEPAEDAPRQDGEVRMNTEQIRSAARKAMKEGQWSQAANGWATLL